MVMDYKGVHQRYPQDKNPKEKQVQEYADKAIFMDTHLKIVGYFFGFLCICVLKIFDYKKAVPSILNFHRIILILVTSGID